MNIFKRELKSHKNSLIFWSIGLIFLIGSGMSKYGVYQNTGQSMNELLAQFPKSFQTIFGMSGFDLSNASGYYGVLFSYIALMTTIHASMLGADLISKEERDRTSEFLFVKPVSRVTVVTWKLLAGLLNLIILNVITLLSSIIFVSYYNKGASINSDIYLLMVGLFFLQLIFYSLGAAVASYTKKPKFASSLATAYLLGTYLITIIINLNETLDNLKYFTPFRYFDAKNLMYGPGIETTYIALSLSIVVIAITSTYYLFRRRDLNI